MGKANIVWQNQTGAGASGWNGLAGGKLDLVSVSYSTMRTGPKWIVRTSLPVSVPARLSGSDDPEQAREMAEALMSAFLKTIGAGWL